MGTRIERIYAEFIFQAQTKQPKIRANPLNPCHPRFHCIAKAPAAKYRFLIVWVLRLQSNLAFRFVSTFEPQAISR
jgi:hypothetical protein